MNRVALLSPEAFTLFVETPAVRTYVSKIHSTVYLDSPAHSRKSVVWANGFARNPEAFIAASGAPTDRATLTGLCPLAFDLAARASMRDDDAVTAMACGAARDVDIRASLATGICGQDLSRAIDGLGFGESLLQRLVGDELYASALYLEIRRTDISADGLLRYAGLGVRDPLDVVRALDEGWPDEYLSSASEFLNGT